MAEDPIGQRKEMKAPWTKIFTAFKVALDLKKLLLAAAGTGFAGSWRNISLGPWTERSLSRTGPAATVSSRSNRSKVRARTGPQFW